MNGRDIILVKSVLYAPITYVEGQNPLNLPLCLPIGYPIRGFQTCATRFVVYLITCPCPKQYVGCTTHTFSTRVEYIAKIKSGDTKQTVPIHYREHHNCNLEGTSFMVIDSYIPLWRGGARTRGVSQLERYWIYELRSYHPWRMLNGTLINF